jgi:hypothetical protein
MEDSGISGRTGRKPGEQKTIDDPPLTPVSINPTDSRVNTFFAALE